MVGTQLCTSVFAIDDTLIEDDEMFNISLTTTTADASLATFTPEASVATITIVQDSNDSKSSCKKSLKFVKIVIIWLLWIIHDSTRYWSCILMSTKFSSQGIYAHSEKKF
jgi:hypothetical protein